MIKNIKICSLLLAPCSLLLAAILGFSVQLEGMEVDPVDSHPLVELIRNFQPSPSAALAPDKIDVLSIAKKAFLDLWIKKDESGKVVGGYSMVKYDENGVEKTARCEKTGHYLWELTPEGQAVLEDISNLSRGHGDLDFFQASIPDWVMFIERHYPFYTGTALTKDALKFSAKGLGAFLFAHVIVEVVAEALSRTGKLESGKSRWKGFDKECLGRITCCSNNGIFGVRRSVLKVLITTVFIAIINQRKLNLYQLEFAAKAFAGFIAAHFATELCCELKDRAKGLKSNTPGWKGFGKDLYKRAIEGKKGLECDRWTYAKFPLKAVVTFCMFAAYFFDLGVYKYGKIRLRMCRDYLNAVGPIFLPGEGAWKPV